MSNATDAAVKLAAEHDIDLADVAGTGADGRITKGDVEAHVAALAEAAEAEGLLLQQMDQKRPFPLKSMFARKHLPLMRQPPQRPLRPTSLPGYRLLTICPR